MFLASPGRLMNREADCPPSSAFATSEMQQVPAADARMGDVGIPSPEGGISVECRPASATRRSSPLDSPYTWHVGPAARIVSRIPNRRRRAPHAR
jgi:hypothetical protein